MNLNRLTALALFAASAALATDLYWDANGVDPNVGTTAPGTWGINAFWNDSSTGTDGTLTAATTTSDNLFFSSGSNYTGAFTVTLSSTRSAGTLTVQEGNVTLTGAGVTGTTLTTINPGATLQLGSGGTTGSVAGTIANAGTLIWNRSNAGFSNTLGGTGSLILTGGGDYAINIGTSSGWTGSTTVKPGTAVTASQGSAFGQNLAAPLTIESGATVKMSGSAGIFLTPITLSGTGVNGLGAIYGNVANPFITGRVTLAGDALVRNDNSGATIFFDGDVSDVGLTGAGTLTLKGAGSFRFNSGNANDNTKGLITETSSANPVSLLIQGPGTTTINPNANSFTGPVTIDGGTLSIASIANLGSNSSIGTGDATNTASNQASLVFGGGMLRITSTSTTDRLFTIGDANGLSAAINSSNNAVNFNNPGPLAYGGSGARTLTLTGTNTSNNQFAPLIGDGPGGATSLVKSSTGTWSLTQTSVNTYTGGTTVSGGTLNIGASSTLGANVAGNNITITEGGRLSLAAAANVGGNQTVSLVASGTVAPTTTNLNGALPQLTVAYDAALPTFAADSQAGVIALGANYSQALDFSTLPAAAQPSFLGASSNVNYAAGTLTPAADGIYRLGGGGSTLTMTSTSPAITGAGNKLMVGTTLFNGVGTTNGTGTVALQGANDYTGSTTVNPGSTLMVSGASGSIAGSSAITVIGGTLNLDNNSGNADRVGDTTPVALERGTLSLNRNPGTNTTETIGDLTLTTTGVVSVTTNASRVTTLGATAIGRDGVATGLMRGANLGGNGNTTNISRITLADTSGLNLIGTTDANTATGTSSTTNLKISPWLLADTSSSVNGSNFATYDSGATGGIRPLSAGETVTFAALAAADENVRDTSTAITVAAAAAMNSLVLAPTGTATLGGGGTGSLAIASGGLALVTNQTTTVSNFTALTIGNATDKEAIVHTTTGTLSLGSPINAGLDYGLTKGGGGTLTLAATNTFTGTVTINAGTLNINGSSTQSGTVINGGTLSVGASSTGALGGASAPVDINSGGTLSVNITNSPPPAFGGGNFNLNDGGRIAADLNNSGSDGNRLYFANKVVVSGNGYLTATSGAGSGNKTYMGPIDMTDGAMLTIYRSSNSNNTLGTDTVTLAGDATFNILVPGANPARAVNFAQVTGNGNLIKRGIGDLMLGCANFTLPVGAASDYVGDTYIEEGMLRMGLTNALPSSTTVHISPDGVLNLSVGASEGITAANFDLAVAGLNDGAAGGGSITANSYTTNLGTTRTLTLGGSGTYAFSGLISNSISTGTATLALTKSGSGIQTLSGPNTYTGVTTLSGGVLAVTLLANGGSASGIGAATNAAANLLLDGGTLRYTGATASTDRLFTLGPGGGTIAADGTGPLTFANATALAYSGSSTRNLTLAGDGPGLNTFAPVITDGPGGTTSLAKLGDGTWVLTGNNLYTGTTTVSTGTLVVDGSLASSSRVTVSANASLAGTGTVGTIGGAGSVDPGDSPGLLTATQVDPTGGLDFNFEFTLKNAVPIWAAVENDVLHLTDPTTPFTSALNGNNIISLYLSSALYTGLVDGDVLYGGFYTDAGDHFLAISGAVLDVYYEDAGGAILYNGVNYSPLSDPLASFSIGTNAEVAPGGYLTQFNYSYAIIPEPASFILLAVGALGLLRRRR